MIDEIQVENLALIRKGELYPGDGLTVLTGETGAGKTALLSALKLLIGERADKDAIREGEESLRVSGRFYLDGSDEETVVTRSVNREGRSRVSINGAIASVGELAQAIAPSIDLCSQHEHQQLMRSQNHQSILDAWIGEEGSAVFASYEAAFEAAEVAHQELERIREARLSSAAQVEQARFTLKQIDAVDPREGEYEELQASLARTEHAESLATSAHDVYEALSGDQGALDALQEALATLSTMAALDESLAPTVESLREAVFVAEDAARDMRSYRDRVDFDPALLEEQQERMAVLQGLLRTYGPRIEDVLAKREEAADLVSLIEDSDLREEAAQRAVDEAEETLAQAATALATLRREAAEAFSLAVSQQMARLEMGSASLVCEVADLDRGRWTKTGPVAVEFLFRPAASMQARPLAKIASGGEISRVMLAIKVVLGARDEVDTLIFDEIDAGVGGATAHALALVLADLAKTHQVIVVTHLAQIAVVATKHYVVHKEETVSEGREEDSIVSLPNTRLQAVDGEERVREIARMLSGETSEASLAHARDMLGNARSHS